MQVVHASIAERVLILSTGSHALVRLDTLELCVKPVRQNNVHFVERNAGSTKNETSCDITIAYIR